MEPFPDAIRVSRMPPSLHGRVLGGWSGVAPSAPPHATGGPQPRSGGQITVRGGRREPADGDGTAAVPTQRNGAGRSEAVRSGGLIVPVDTDAVTCGLARSSVYAMLPSPESEIRSASASGRSTGSRRKLSPGWPAVPPAAPSAPPSGRDGR